MNNLSSVWHIRYFISSCKIGLSLLHRNACFSQLHLCLCFNKTIFYLQLT